MTQPFKYFFEGNSFVITEEEPNMENNKPLNYYDVEKNLQLAVNDGKIIHLVSYSMSNDIEKKLDKTIENILEKYNKTEMQGLIYTSVKELAINGTKANLKRIFFEEKGYDLDNPEDYDKGMVEYKEHMIEEKAIEYGKIAKQKGLFVRISFFHDPTGMRVEVINNTAITPQEERRLREKLAKIMKYEDLMEFYMENADNTEGAGMGLALITTMLKGEAIDPNLFRIITTKEQTTARIEIPFTADYISLRERAKK